MSNARDPLAELRAQVGRVDMHPGLAKADPRAIFRSTAHASNVAAVDYLLAMPGASVRSVARLIGCDHSALIEWMQRGDQSHAQWPGWFEEALPDDAYAVKVQHQLRRREAQRYARTGTND